MLAVVTDLERRISQFHPELVGWLRRRVVGDPEEVAQEVWLRVSTADASFPNDASFRGYFYTVARRLIVDLHRRRRARIELVEMDEHTARRAEGHVGAPDGRLHAEQMHRIVEQTLAAMKPEISQVFLWRLHQDVPFKDIAERQGCSLNTALGRMHRATKKIATALKAAGLTGGAP